MDVAPSQGCPVSRPAPIGSSASSAAHWSRSGLEARSSPMDHRFASCGPKPRARRRRCAQSPSQPVSPRHLPCWSRLDRSARRSSTKRSKFEPALAIMEETLHNNHGYPDCNGGKFKVPDQSGSARQASHHEKEAGDERQPGKPLQNKRRTRTAMKTRRTATNNAPASDWLPSRT